MNRTLAIIFFLFNFLLVGSLQAEEASPKITKAKDKDEEVSFSDLFRSRRGEAYVGVILANFLYIDPTYRFVYIKPQEGYLPRITVYLDRRTSYSTMKVGKLGKGKKELMVEGDRVALRVFVKNGIILADEMFFVEGEFGPKARFAKRKYSSAHAGGAKKEGEKKSGGGH